MYNRHFFCYADDTTTRHFQQLTYSQALQLVINNNPKLKAVDSLIDTAKTRKTIAEVSPELELEIEVEGIDDSGIDNTETAIVLSKTIETGGKKPARRKTTELERIIAETNQAATIKQLTSETTIVFYDILFCQQKLQLAKDSLKNTEDTYSLTQRQYELGKGTKTDTAHARTDTFNAQRQLKQAQYQLESAKAKLQTLWDSSDTDFEIASGEFEGISEPVSWQELQNSAKNTPAFKMLELELQLSKARVNLEYAESVNDFSISAGVQYFRESNDNAFIIGMAVPISSSKKNKAAIQQASSSQAVSQQNYFAAKAELDYELSDLYLQWCNAYETVTDIQKQLLPAAEEVYSAAEKEYKLGKISFLNFLEARETLFDSRSQYLESLAEYHNIKADIIAITNLQ